MGLTGFRPCHNAFGLPGRMLTYSVTRRRHFTLSGNRPKRQTFNRNGSPHRQSPDLSFMCFEELPLRSLEIISNPQEPVVAQGLVQCSAEQGVVIDEEDMGQAVPVQNETM